MVHDLNKKQKLVITFCFNGSSQVVCFKAKSLPACIYMVAVVLNCLSTDNIYHFNEKFPPPLPTLYRHGIVKKIIFF